MQAGTRIQVRGCLILPPQEVGLVIDACHGNEPDQSFASQS